MRIVQGCLWHMIRTGHNDIAANRGQLVFERLQQRNKHGVSKYTLIFRMIDNKFYLLGKKSWVNGVTDMSGA